MAHAHSANVRVGPVDTPNGTVYMYSVGGYLSQRTYHNAVSAWHDARKPQAFVGNRMVGQPRIVPTESLAASLEPYRR